MRMMDRLARQMKHSYEILDQIQKKLEESGEDMQGGYQCTYPVFCGIYHVVSRMMERGGSERLPDAVYIGRRKRPSHEGWKTS